MRLRGRGRGRGRVSLQQNLFKYTHACGRVAVEFGLIYVLTDN